MTSGCRSHLKVLKSAGLVTKTKDGQRRTVHLQADVFDLMTKWVERYRRQAELRYQRLDDLLAEMNHDQSTQPAIPEQKEQSA